MGLYSYGFLQLYLAKSKEQLCPRVRRRQKCSCLVGLCVSLERGSSEELIGNYLQPQAHKTVGTAIF
jgi:hypothetical protein